MRLRRIGFPPMSARGAELNEATKFHEDRRVVGKGTKAEVVRACSEKEIEWLIAAPVCELLQQRHMLHVGIMHAADPFEIIRTDQSGTFMLACFSGKGRVLVDGRWKTVVAGEACLLPPFVANALKCIAGEKWEFAWVRYIESRESVPIVSDVSPVTGSYDPEPLRSAISGLIAESCGERSHAMQHLWVDLIHNYVMRFSLPLQKDDRLWKLWKAVEPDYKYQWTLSELAQLAFVSEEHLRRLCKKQLGRSPMQHLTFLRMQRASKLLATTDEKIQAIANEVGYSSAFHFSNVFTKWVGWRPSEHRGK